MDFFSDGGGGGGAGRAVELLDATVEMGESGSILDLSFAVVLTLESSNVVVMDREDSWSENTPTFFLVEKLVNRLLSVSWDEVSNEQRVMVSGVSHGCNRQSLAVIRSLASRHNNL